MKQKPCSDFVSTSLLRLSQSHPDAAFTSSAPSVSRLLHPRLSPVSFARARPARAVAKPSVSADRGASAVLQLLSSVVGAVSSVLPSPLYAAAHPQRRRPHVPPVPRGEAERHGSPFSREGANDDVTAEGGGLLGSFLGPSITAGEAPTASEGRTVLRTAPTIRPRRRVPGRRSSPDWQQLFPDLRLVDVALPATLHSALTDVNSVKYFELAVAQKVPVSRQLLDGIRMFDVRAWRDAQDGHWYSEVPWRLEDDFRLLREHAPTAEEASPSNFVSSMLRNLPAPLRPGGGKERGRKGQQHGSDRRRGGAAANGGGAGGRKVPAKVLSLVDLHSWTSLEEGLFKPVQEFLRTHISEVAVVVISSFNGNRKTTMNAVPRGASLASSLQRLAVRQQQRQQEGTAAGSSSARLEGHPFYEELIYRAAPDASASGGAGGTTKQQQQPRNVGGASGRAGIVGDYPADSIPVLSPAATHNSPAYLDSLGTSPAAYEVQDPLDTTSSFYMSSAVRKPLTYADVASFMALVDKYWGQLLPRHSHVFFGPADDTAYASVPAAQAVQTSPAAASSPGAGSPVGAAAAAAASQTQPVPAADAAPSSPATSMPSAAALQQAPTPSVPRLLTAAAGSPAVTAMDEQTLSMPASTTSSKLGAGALVEGETTRSTGAMESEVMEKSTSRAQTDASEQSAANAVTPIAPLVGGAPARGVATPDLRAAPSRTPVPATAATSAGPAVDTQFAGAGPGATAAVFNSGFDASPNLYSSADRRQLPTGRPPASAAYREPEATSTSIFPEGGAGAAAGTRAASAEYSHFGAAASIANQIDSYPMYESLHRPETFAEWLRAQGDLLLAKATLKDLIDAKIRLLLFVDDPLIAWYITVFSREHVVVFVAADHIYDVLYKSEALFGPCALPNRASGAPNSMLLSVTREAAWAGCRERCESTPPVTSRPEEGRLMNKMRQTRGRAAAARDTSANSRSCTYWTFEPPVSLASLPPVVNNGDELYPPVSPADLGLLPFAPVAGSNVNANRGSQVVGQQQDAGKGGSAAAAIGSAAPLEMKGECRTYTGPLTLADTVPLHGSIIQPRSCGLRTLYELPTQWASAAVFADLTDAVCPIFEVPGGTSGSGDSSIDPSGRPVADGLGDAATLDARDARQQKEPRSFQFLPELCMLDATPRSLRDLLQAQDEDDGLQRGEDTLHTNLKKWRGMGLERKLLRVYFSPPSPVPFVDGTRGGKREVGPVDAVSLMNELTATWALWQLERQQLVGSLTVIEPIDPMGLAKDDGYAYVAPGFPPEESPRVAPGESNTGRGSASMGVGGGGAGRSSFNAFYGGAGPPLFVGRERPRSTRPVNALMVMRYDQTKSLIKNFSHLNYFEIVMNLNPQPRETRSVIFQGSDGADFSADRYVKVTAILNSFGLEDELGEIGGHLDADGLDADDTTEEEKRAQAFMMWLAICAAIVCLIVAIVGSTVRSAVSKRVPRGGWTAAVTPRRASMASEPSPPSHHLENLS